MSTSTARLYTSLDASGSTLEQQTSLAGKRNRPHRNLRKRGMRTLSGNFHAMLFAGTVVMEDRSPGSARIDSGRRPLSEFFDPVA